MKISKYTFFIKIDDNSCYLYNSFTNSLVKVSGEVYDTLFMQQKESDVNFFNIKENSELLDGLKKGMFITHNDEDDLLSLQALLEFRRRSKEIHNITIIPTLDCNFSCYYCFEEHIKEYMDEETENAIVNYINSQKDLKFLNLTWFGGEPLLAIESIERISQSLKLPDGAESRISIITNGYYLTPNNLSILKKANISSIQLSIDGIYKNYNDVKKMPADKDCFSTILSNIDFFSANEQDIRMNIRVNLSKKNYETYLDVYHFFRERYKKSSNIFILPAFLKNNSDSSCSSGTSCFFNRDEKIEQNEYFYKKIKDKYFTYPLDVYNECAIRNMNTLAFAPYKKVYKCWENIDNEEYRIGSLDTEGRIQIENVTNLNRYLFGADPLADQKCRKCNVFPICFGGCPQERLYNKFDGRNIDVCSLYKESIINNIKNRILYENE